MSVACQIESWNILDCITNFNRPLCVSLSLSLSFLQQGESNKQRENSILKNTLNSWQMVIRPDLQYYKFLNLYTIKIKFI